MRQMRHFCASELDGLKVNSWAVVAYIIDVDLSISKAAAVRLVLLQHAPWLVAHIRQRPCLLAVLHFEVPHIDNLFYSVAVAEARATKLLQDLRDFPALWLQSSRPCLQNFWFPTSWIAPCGNAPS